jgi:hypothetical protein
MNKNESVFDARGMLRADIDQVQVAPERQPVLAALVTAVRAAEAAEADVKLKDAAVAAAVKVHDRAVAALPKSTFLDEHRNMLRQRQIDLGRAPPRPEPEGEPVSPLPHIALRMAEDALDQARHELRVARDTLTRARERVGRRLADYNASQPIMTPLQNTRAWIASNNADRAARAGHPYARALKGVGPSAVDRTAAAYAGGNSRAGGGKSYSRGGVSLAEAARLNAQRIRLERAKEAFNPAKVHAEILANARRK